MKTESHGPEPSLDGLRVLLVEDDDDARELVSTVLASARANVLTAASAAEGFDLVQAEQPDVIVSDIGMPGRDGYDFIRDVRGLSAACGGRIPAIALTAFVRSEDRARALLAGFQVHVSKPTEARQLVATIKHLADQARGMIE